MTDLNKPISRRTTILTDNRQEPRRRDTIVVTLFPDKSIGFRELGRRRLYLLPLATVYKLAVIETEKQERQARGRKRARRAKNGLRHKK